MENPSKSEVIGRCGGDEKTNDNTEPPKVESPNLKKNKKIYCAKFNLQLSYTISVFLP